MATNKVSWLCYKKQIDKRIILENILPENYQYRVSNFKIVQESPIVKETKFEAMFAVNICSEEGFLKFLTEFQESSSTNYNISSGNKKNGKKHLFSGSRKCIHNLRKRKKSGEEEVLADHRTPGKQTNCPANISFKMKNTDDHDHDENCSLFPLEITLLYIHNHSIVSASAVKYHEVHSATKEAFNKLFEEDHTASSAYQEYKNLLMKKYGEEYIIVSADRAIMPDYRWVFNFHALYMQNNFGKINSPEAFEKAIEKAKQYNDKHGVTLCTVTQVDGETIVAVCDMLSRRVHKVLPQSGDIVYVDTTSNLDRQDSKLTKFMTCSPAGGLPLGFVVTSSESEKVLTTAFKALKLLLPNDAFYNRQSAGPVLFMTDDANAEVNALRHVWPEATFLLCVWHVLTAVWRWLWDAKHQIRKDDRASLFKMFRAVLYAETEDDYENKKELLLNDEVCVSYPSYIRHLQIAYFNRKETWAISFRNDQKLPTHSTNTSNYIEASFRLTKDGQFNRTKAYNLPDLLDILLDDSVYYKKRLLDIGNGRLGAFKNNSKYGTKIKEDQIIEIGDLIYIVTSEKKEDTFYIGYERWILRMQRRE